MPKVAGEVWGSARHVARKVRPTKYRVDSSDALTGEDRSLLIDAESENECSTKQGGKEYFPAK